MSARWCCRYRAVGAVRPSADSKSLRGSCRGRPSLSQRRRLRSRAVGGQAVLAASSATDEAAATAPDGYVRTLTRRPAGGTAAKPRQPAHGGTGSATVRFVRPPGYVSSGREQDLPFCLYFPAIDGQGLTASPQFQRLCAAFDLRAMRLDAADRTAFPDLVNLSLEYLSGALEGSPATRPVYLIGESWGALLALGTALECEAVQRVALVSPATVAGDTILSRLLQVAAPALALAGPMPGAIQRLLPLAVGPSLGKPSRLVGHWLDPSAGPTSLLPGLSEAASALLSQASAIVQELPPATLDWRLKLMRRAIEDINPRLGSVEQRVLIVVGDDDQLLPAAEEAKRLDKIFQRSGVRVVAGAGHSLLQEHGVDLLSIMKEEGFYIRERKFTSAVSPTSRVGNNYGKSGPLELPTRKDLDRTFQEYEMLGKLTSPVFFSEAAGGGVHRGLDHVFSDYSRPILLIGNHQLMGLDMSFMVRQFLIEKGRLMRGLTHPMIFEGSGGGGTMSGMRSTFTSFGSVPVGPTSFFRLLQANEMVLLFPGGAREALKKRGEKYELFWPEQQEFVRMAARFGAVIVPFGAIGCEDSLEYILDSEEVMNNSEAVKRYLGSEAALALELLRNTQARRGVNAGAIDDYLVPPVLAPSVPSRFYYLFKQPIFLSPEMAKDRDQCAKVYDTVKHQVEASLAYLVKKREVDPYRDFFRRMAHEMLSGEQAPTFRP